MIGKVCFRRKDGKKTNFMGLVNYCTNLAKAAYVGFQNVTSVEDAGIEMEILSSDNTRCADPGYHFVLSWREMEMPTPEQCEEAADMALSALGLENCQAVWALHTNTENAHLEFAVNRIDPITSRAVRPADGWDKKALHKVCREIEMRQGWSRDNGIFVAAPNGEIVEREKSESLTPSLSTNAQDMEAHIAQKSAERIGQEVAAPIIRESQSWEEVHSRLGKRGIRYERKGSGAVLFVGETPIKASTAGRDLTLIKLELRLGEFREASQTLTKGTVSRPPEPVERASVPKVRGKWEEFISLRTEYFKSKKEAEIEMRDRHRQERSVMSKRHKDERKKIYSVAWKGRGAELNRLRSVTASVQKAESLYLRDRQNEEKKALRGRYPIRFPTFKAWLDLDEHSPELSILYRYPNDPTLYSPFGSPLAKQPLFMEDLRDFQARIGNKGSVAYIRRGGRGNAADFVDYGRKILIAGKYDKKTLLAALQLGQQKWGGVNISGDDRYKKLCIEVAMQEGIRIFIDGKEVPKKMGTPVAEKIVKADKQSLSRKTPEELVETRKEDFRRYTAAVGADEYRVTLIDRLSGGTKAFVWGKGKESSGKHSGEKILQDMESIVRHAEKNLSITVTPISKKTHHILVDDMTAESLERFKADGYDPACVIESSPGNFQAVLNVPKFAADDPSERDRANRLVRELNRAYGDKNLSGAEHAHRMPGFPNCKEKHRKADGTFPESVLLEAQGGVCDKAVERLTEIRREVLRREAQQKEVERFISSQPGSAVEAYWKHYDNIIDYQGTPDDYSKLDSMIALRLKVTGHSQTSIQSAVEICAPQARRQSLSENAYIEKYGMRNWKDYAQRTAGYAFSGKSAGQEARLVEFLNRLLKIEGRPSEKTTGASFGDVRRGSTSSAGVAPDFESVKSSLIDREKDTGTVKETDTLRNARSVSETVDERKNFVPQIGSQIIFHSKKQSVDGAKKQEYIIGKILDMDDVKGTVTIERGKEKYVVFRGMGYFTPAKEVPLEQTKEYAMESARKLVGNGGKIYSASQNGEYRGEILEVGSAYAAQRIGRSTVILHRLKDFETPEMLQKGLNVIIKRASGRSFVAENTRESGQGKDQSMNR